MWSALDAGRGGVSASGGVAQLWLPCASRVGADAEALEAPASLAGAAPMSPMAVVRMWATIGREQSVRSGGPSATNARRTRRRPRVRNRSAIARRRIGQGATELSR